MQKAKKWTGERVAFLKSKEGQTLAQITNAYNVVYCESLCKKTIADVCKENGIQYKKINRKIDWTKEKKEFLKEHGPENTMRDLYKMFCDKFDKIDIKDLYGAVNRYRIPYKRILENSGDKKTKIKNNKKIKLKKGSRYNVYDLTYNGSLQDRQVITKDLVYKGQDKYKLYFENTLGMVTTFPNHQELIRLEEIN